MIQLQLNTKKDYEDMLEFFYLIKLMIQKKKIHVAENITFVTAHCLGMSLSQKKGSSEQDWTFEVKQANFQLHIHTDYLIFETK